MTTGANARQALRSLTDAARLDVALRPTPALPWPVVFINLARDRARCEAMRSRFAQAGVTASRLDAVQWTALDTATQAVLYSDALNARQYHLPLSAGEKGCYTSHLLAWQMLADSSFDALVVLEDDVLLAGAFADQLRALAELRGDCAGWDMVKLISRDGERPRWRYPLGECGALIAYRRVPSWTAGYVIRRDGARKLLDARLPFGRPVDVDLRYCWEAGVTVRGLLPNAIALAPESLSSSVDAKRPKSWPVRWRRMSQQMHYSLRNRLHTLTRP